MRMKTKTMMSNKLSNFILFLYYYCRNKIDIFTNLVYLIHFTFNFVLISDDVEDEDDDDDDDDDDDGDAPQLVRDPKKGFSMSSVILFKY